MKVIIEWEETWARTAEIEVDKDALDAWLAEGGYAMPTASGPLEATLREYLESSRDFDNPAAADGLKPGSRKGDTYCDFELTRARPAP